MYSIIFKKFWVVAALSLLTALVVVIALHPFVPHNHNAPPLEQSPFVTLHTGVVERSALPVAALAVFFQLFALSFMVLHFSHALAQRGVQNVNIQTFLALRAAFRHGLLNTKSY